MSFFEFLTHNLKKYSIHVPVIPASISFLIGILAGDSFLATQKDLLYIICVLLIVIVVFTSRRGLRLILLCLLSFSIGVLRIWEASERGYPRVEALAKGEDVENLDVEIVDYKVKNGSTYIVVDQIHRDGVRYQGKAQLKIHGSRDFIRGQGLNASTVLKAPENYSEFDYIEYLQRKGIYAIGDLSQYEVSSGEGLVYTVDSIRSSIIRRIRENFGEPESSLLLGLTIGYRADFDEEFKDQLSKTGTTHIVAASGYNVSLVLGSMAGLVAVLGRRPSVLLGIAVCILFCIFTGFNLPVVRASIMAIIGIIAFESGREAAGIIAMFLSAFVLVLINPFSLWDLGLQLSFLSTIGVFYVANMMVNTALGKKVPGIVSDSLFTSLGAFILTLPLIVNTFGQISLLLFISNIFVLPLVSLSTILGFLVIFSVMISGFVAKVISLLVYVPLHYIVSVIRHISRLPFGMVEAGIENGALYTFYYIFILLLIMYLGYRNYLYELSSNESA